MIDYSDELFPPHDLSRKLWVVYCPEACFVDEKLEKFKLESFESYMDELEE